MEDRGQLTPGGSLDAYQGPGGKWGRRQRQFWWGHPKMGCGLTKADSKRRVLLELIQGASIETFIHRRPSQQPFFFAPFKSPNLDFVEAKLHFPVSNSRQSSNTQPKNVTGSMHNIVIKKTHCIQMQGPDPAFKGPLKATTDWAVRGPTNACVSTRHP